MRVSRSGLVGDYALFTTTRGQRTPRLCPTTAKISFISRRAAEAYIADSVRNGTFIKGRNRAYRCPDCNAIHITSKQSLRRTMSHVRKMSVLRNAFDALKSEVERGVTSGARARAVEKCLETLERAERDLRLESVQVPTADALRRNIRHYLVTYRGPMEDDIRRLADVFYPMALTSETWSLVAVQRERLLTAIEDAARGLVSSALVDAVAAMCRVVLHHAEVNGLDVREVMLAEFAHVSDEAHAWSEIADASTWETILEALLAIEEAAYSPSLATSAA